MTSNPVLEQLREGYLKSLADKLLALKKAAETHDFDAISRIGHQLKGSGRSYGFHEISELGGRIEQIGLDRRTALLDFMLVEFKTLLESLTNKSVATEKP